MAEAARPADSGGVTIGFPAARGYQRRVDPSAGRGREIVGEAGDQASLPAAGRPRLASLDTLRGFSLFWILGPADLALALKEMTAGKAPVVSAIGNFIGGQFTHAEWEGLRFYDLVFPLFIFTVGVSIVFSLRRLVEREGKLRAHGRVVRRALLLFGLGLVFYGGVAKLWPDTRLMGVLQRIALCYLFASLLFLHLSARGLAFAFAAILLGYWALLTFVPVPGLGAASYARDVNLANWIDAHYLPGQKWGGPWDPEGLLSTLPATATCLIGVFGGLLLINPRVAPARKSLWLLGGGAVMLVAGMLWGLQFPVIKNIWTSSFVLVTGGYSLVLLGVFHHVVDVWGIRAWTAVFVWLGANAITLYLLFYVANFERMAVRVVGGDIGLFLDRTIAEGAGRFAANALAFGLALALARFLYRRRIFLRV
jgi:predicted acyltransferase